jgi:hypothetical protein
MPGTEDKFICKHCKKVFKKAGWLKQHELYCKAASNGQTARKEVKNNKCDNGGEHEFRLLNPMDKNENHAISKGYKYICDKCTEVK